jgi:arylsulfatase A-like enzyme
MSAGNASDAYGTDQQWPSWLYPEDGRMVPGVKDHEGGDHWVADITTAIMDHQDWSGIFVNFGAIDKIGHMWGGGSTDTFWDPDSLMNQVHMRFIAKNADDQLGKLLDELRKNDELKDTLVVVTADHASTHAVNFNGVPGKGGGTPGWYYDPNNKCVNTTYGRSGVDANGTPKNNEAVLGALNVTKNIAYSYQSTAIETWLIDQSAAKKVETAKVMATLPGVIATYVKSEDGNRYVLQCNKTSTRMNVSEFIWWLLHGQELVDTMAFPGAADVVGLLADNTSYGVFGDHGGAQMDVQRIPMAFYAPGIKHVVTGAKFRTVDIMPTVLRTMGIAPTAPMDGTAYDLPMRGTCQ